MVGKWVYHEHILDFSKNKCGFPLFFVLGHTIVLVRRKISFLTTLMQHLIIYGRPLSKLVRLLCITKSSSICESPLNLGMALLTCFPRFDSSCSGVAHPLKRNWNISRISWLRYSVYDIIKLVTFYWEKLDTCYLRRYHLTFSVAMFRTSDSLLKHVIFILCR